MTRFGSSGPGAKQAMSKSNGPWGSGERGSDPAGDAGSDTPPPEAPAGDAPDASRARNPWLSPDEVSTPAPRRSANIEQIFRNLGNGGNPQHRGAALRWLPWAGLVLLGAWLVSTSVHVIKQDERALVITMGRYTQTLGPGLHLTLPWPGQTVLRREVGKEVTTSLPDKDGETLMLTRDGALIDLTFQLRWQVTDLRQFSFALADPEAAIRRLADAEMRAAVAELPLEDILSGKRQAELQQRVMGRVQAVLNAWHAGVSVTGVEVLRHAPPAQLAATFQKIATARADADKLREQTLSWRGQQLANANVEARDFGELYAKYQLAPEITRTKMYYEMMDRVQRNNMVVLGGTEAPAQAPPPAPPPPEPAAKQEGR